MFDLTKVKRLHMETSNVCNASCPLCGRTTLFSDNKNTTSLTLDKVKSTFDDNFIRNLDAMYMCGNHGDPAAAPETIDIFTYFRRVNPNISMSIHSNGGLRSKKWWGELGSILSRGTDRCYFGIDGLRDTNHIYRVNTDFDKIMENVKSFIGGGGKANWDFLVFEHNEHQVEDARHLSKELGFVSFREKVSGWSIGRDIPFLNPPKGTKYND